MHLRRLLLISRPRFWLYLFGPFLLGYTAGITSLHNFLSLGFLVWGLYFLFPANVFLYGINDIHDFETDQHNPKKREKEAFVQKEEHKTLYKIVCLIAATGIVLQAVFTTSTNDFTLTLGLVAFLLLSYFYSSPPIRAKAVPFLDSLFNILYIMPAVVGYALSNGSFPDYKLLIAGGLWCVAMHAYSAIPDIEVDQKAHIATIATVLGKFKTLIFCTTCYLLSSILVSFQFQEGVFAGGLYCALMLISMKSKPKELVTIYWCFPFINMAVGMGIWILLVVQKFA